MSNDYVSVNGDAYRITGSRVSLDSVVYDYLRGLSPEGIAENFDTLSLEQVYGAITYYLSHRQEGDQHLMRNRVQFKGLRKQAPDSLPLLYRNLEEIREA